MSSPDSSSAEPTTSTTGSAPSPGSAPGSDPTPTPSAPTTSRRRSAATSSSTSTGGSSAGIELPYDSRLFITGTSGCGKSTLARALFLGAAAPRLIIDPNDSDLTDDIAGTVTFRDVRKATNKRGENWREAATARYVPRDPMDRDEYDELYRWVFFHGRRRVWVDEAGFVHPAHGSSKYARLMFTQGRKRGLGMTVCHTRPREVDTNLLAQSRFVAVFDTPSAQDRKHLADCAGVPFAEFESAHARLAEFGFLWIDRAPPRRRLICAPLPV